MCWGKPMADGGAIAEEQEQPPPDTPQICINCLLQKSYVPYWRKGIVGMIKPLRYPEALKRNLRFLISNVTEAIRKINNTGQYLTVPIRYELKPSDLDLVNWRRVLVGMKLVLEEPDTNREIRNIAVSIGPETDVNSLHGIKCVLQGMLELSWDVIRMVTHLDDKKGSDLYEIMTDISMGYSIPSLYTSSLRQLYEENMAAMRSLGFYRRSPEEEVTWSPPRQQQDISSISHVLHGLLKKPTGIQVSD